MPLTVTREQRDAIYAAVINHLTGIGDVWMAVERRDFATARRLGRAFADDLQLLDDLGWSETSERETVVLRMPPGQLTRTIARLHKDATGSLGTYVARPKDDEEIARRDLAASAALHELLCQIADLRTEAGPDDRQRASAEDKEVSR